MKKYVTERSRRIVIILFTSIGLFMLYDTYFTDVVFEKEIILDKIFSKSVQIRGSYKSYEIKTSVKTRTITSDVFSNILVGDTIHLGVSTLTGTVQKISTTFYGINKTFYIGFINSGVGMIFLLIALLLLIIYILLSYNKILFDKTSTTIGFVFFIVIDLYYYFSF